MIFVLLYVVIGTVFAFVGANMARSRGRDPAVWAIVCFFFCLIGVIILAIAGPARTTESLSAQKTGDIEKWRVLVELDPDIRAAATTARNAGADCEEALARKYLTLNDKTYLAAALQAVLADAEANRAVPRFEMASPISIGDVAGVEQEAHFGRSEYGRGLENPSVVVFLAYLASAFIYIVLVAVSNSPLIANAGGIVLMLATLIFCGFLGAKYKSGTSIAKRVALGSAAYWAANFLVTVVVAGATFSARDRYMGGQTVGGTAFASLLQGVVQVALSFGAAFVGSVVAKRIR